MKAILVILAVLILVVVVGSMIFQNREFLNK